VERTEQQLQEKNEELHRVLQEFRFVTDFMPQMVWVTKADGYHEY
jgi:two-component system, chemotaxis family, CheB/CheR fusion protein